GTIRLCLSIGWGATVWIDGLVLQRAGMWVVFPCFAVGLIAVARIVHGFQATVPVPQGAAERPARAAVRAAFAAEPRLRPYLGGILAITTATSAAWNFVPLTIASPSLLGV